MMARSCLYRTRDSLPLRLPPHPRRPVFLPHPRRPVFLRPRMTNRYLTNRMRTTDWPLLPPHRHRLAVPQTLSFVIVNFVPAPPDRHREAVPRTRIMGPHRKQVPPDKVNCPALNLVGRFTPVNPNRPSAGLAGNFRVPGAPCWTCFAWDGKTPRMVLNRPRRWHPRQPAWPAPAARTLEAGFPPHLTGELTPPMG